MECVLDQIFEFGALKQQFVIGRVVRFHIDDRIYRDGKIEFKKPISCHLYPIIVRDGKNGEFDRMNYEPRDVMCKPGCNLGKKLKMPAGESSAVS